jgi:hypothetical protein
VITTMGCARTEELLSEHLERSLAAPLAAAVEAHLQACPRCAELRDAVGEVVGVLHDLEAVEPPAGLAGRAAAAALRLGTRWVAPARPPWPARLQPLPIAAALAVAVGAGVLLATPRVEALRPSERLVARAEGARAFLVERKERLVGDLERFGVLLETALEMRLEDVQDRVDDYRRWLDRNPPEAQRGASVPRRPARSARLSFPNPSPGVLVGWEERMVAGGQGLSRAATSRSES